MESDNSLNIEEPDYWERVYNVYIQMCMAQFSKLENDGEIIQEPMFGGIKRGNRDNNIEFYAKSFTLAKDIVDYFKTTKNCTTD
jgi:hypothetical protein